MSSFVAVLALNDAEGMARRPDYSAGRVALGSLASLVSLTLADACQVHANRRTVEFAFPALSSKEARLRLDDLREAILRRSGHRVTIAAVPATARTMAERDVDRAETYLATAIRDGSTVFVAERESGASSESQLLRDLDRAMEDGSLSLHYQPKLRSSSGEIASAEALLRWHHATLGAVPPDLFIPIAEKSDVIRRLTHWVIDRALADQVDMRAAGVDLPLHVNISASLVADRAFAHAALAQLGDRTPSIGFEITESAMIADPEGALANLKTLADAGVRLAIDDYGTGFSSLAYLQRLPVHELKIDKCFVSALSTSARDPLLVRSTIDLAHALEMEVTAEGVECAASAALLQVMRCDLMQGFFLSRPLPTDGFVAFAHNSVTGSAARPVMRSLRKRLADRRAEKVEAI